MAGIEDLTNIMMAGGRPDVPMGGAPQGAPMPPPPPPPQGGAPMGPPPPPQGGAPMPPTMAEQMPMQEQEMPMQEQEMSVEQDAAALAEAVIGRAGGDPQAAVAILDTAAQMIMQSTQEEPMMAAGGGYMKKPRYAFAGEYLGDESDTLRQMIMDGILSGGADRGQGMIIDEGDLLGEDTGIITDYDTFDTLPDRFWEAYEADPDAFSKDAIEADAVEEERRKAAQRAAAYRSR